MHEHEKLAELMRRTEQAHIEIEKSADHDLSFGRVMSILAIFGPRLELGVVTMQRAQELRIKPEEHSLALQEWKRRA